MSFPFDLTQRRTSSSRQYRASVSVPVRQFASPRPSLILQLNPDTLDACRGLADAALATPTSLGILHRFNQPLTSTATTTQRSSSVKSGKFPCSICQRRMPCLCPSCATRKVHFSKKRSLQRELIRKRDEIAHDIEEVLRDQTRVEKKMLDTRESIENLKFLLGEKRRNILEKKKNLKEVDEKLARTQKNITDLQVICNQHNKVLSRPLAKKAEIEKLRKTLYVKHHEMALQLFREVFPLAKQEKKCGDCVCLQQSEKDRRIPEQIADASRNMKDGKELLTPVADELEKPSIHYSINGFCLNDCGEYGLKCWPKCAASCRSRDSSLAMHSALAALTCGVQLVAILPFIFDVVLPCQVSLRELALREKIAEDSLSVDIAKLNVSVVFLCLNEGIDPAAIDPRRPFANLMLFYEACSAEQPMIVRPCVITEQLMRIMDKDLK
uniref:Uncharacterized protein n=1 Tax=Parascaris univalens TaxID=6257 RepID=A0A915CF35_PARUN